MKTLGLVLREERVKRRLDESDVANAVGCTQQRISQIEHGAKPSAKLLKKLADYYGRSFAELAAMSIEEPHQGISKPEAELIKAVRNKNVSKAMRLVEAMVFAEPA